VAQQRLRQLVAGVLGVPEAPRQGRSRVRLVVRFRVREQRQDRVVVRRRGELDLAALGRRAVGGHDRAQERQLAGAQPRLVGLVVPAALGGQRAHVGIVRQPVEVEPGELRQHLQVEEVLLGEDGRARVQRRPLRHGAAEVPQLEEARPGRHQHVRHQEERAQGERLLVRRERGGRHQADPQLALRRPVLRVRLQLVDERRNQVEGRVHGRRGCQRLQHAEVVAQRVQAHPGQQERAVHRVAVRRLVHVPDERDPDLRPAPCPRVALLLHRVRVHCIGRAALPGRARADGRVAR
jgi:hypothetical protein